ncbi:hypothetical protein [Longimicrobium sp.]|uniref:hypothetical protein n=1 Tax=Longimicrobium sp. TaxID=2029185 RepID=UPI003B3B8838
MRRTWTRRLSLAGIALTLAAGPARAQELPPAREIIARYWTAIGGVQAVSAPRFRRTIGEMTTDGLTMSVNFIQARPDRMVMRGEIPGLGTVEQGFDGTIGWMVVPGQGARLLQGPELQQVQNQAKFDSNLRFDEYPVMETIGRAEVDGRACWQVRMVTPENDEARGCFGVDDGYLLSISVTTPEQTTITFGDYRPFGALTLPGRTVVTAAGQQVVLTVSAIHHDPIPAAEFEPPAEIKAQRPK